MKFQCERCRTRYSIADEKVRGKILKIRCKACEAIITVRDGAPPKLTAAPAGEPRVRAASHTIELQTVGKPSGVSVTPALPPDRGTDPRAKIPELEEWFLSIDGVQEGPLSAEAAQKRVASKPPGTEMFAWRDDFSEWQAVEEVPVLAVHLQKARPRPPTMPPRMPVDTGLATQASRPLPVGDPFGPQSGSVDEAGESGDPFAALSPPMGTPPVGTAPVAGAGAFDFDIGEASRVVKLPILPPPLIAPTRSPGGLPGVDGSAAESLKLNIAPVSSDVGPVVPGAESVSTSAVSSSRPRRRLWPVIGAAVAALALLAVIAVFALQGDEPKPAAATEPAPETVLVNNFYTKENPMFARENAGTGAAPEKVVEVTPPPEPTTAPAADKPRSSGSSGSPMRPRIVLPPSGGTASRPAPSRGGGGKEDSFDVTSGYGPLSPDDVRAMYGANEVGLKRCYERALKNDPALSVTKMVVKISIQPDGRVTDIKVPDRGELADCVAGNIRGWRFRRSTDELTTEFTVFFARRN